MVGRVLRFGLVVFGAWFGERLRGRGVVWGGASAIQTLSFALWFNFDRHFPFGFWSPGGFWEAVGGVDRVTVKIYDWAVMFGAWASIGGIGARSHWCVRAVGC